MPPISSARSSPSMPKWGKSENETHRRQTNHHHCHRSFRHTGTTKTHRRFPQGTGWQLLRDVGLAMQGYESRKHTHTSLCSKVRKISDRISSGPKYDRVCGFRARTRPSLPNTTATHHAGPVAMVVAVAVEAVRPLAPGFWSTYKTLPGDLRNTSNSASVGQICFGVNELLWWPPQKITPCLCISYVSRFPKRIHGNVFAKGKSLKDLRVAVLSAIKKDSTIHLSWRNSITFVLLTY